LGPNDSETILAKTSLAKIFVSLGDYDEAESIFQVALLALQAIVPPNNEQLLDLVFDFAGVYMKKQQWLIAKEMLERAIRGYEASIGVGAFKTFGPINNLGFVCARLGLTAEAKDFFDRALAGKLLFLGASHPDTLNTIGSQASLYAEVGDNVNALETYERALSGFLSALGADHTRTLNTACNYCHFLLSTNNLKGLDAVLARCPSAIAHFPAVASYRVRITFRLFRALYENFDNELTSERYAGFPQNEDISFVRYVNANGKGIITVQASKCFEPSFIFTSQTSLPKPTLKELKFALHCAIVRPLVLGSSVRPATFFVDLIFGRDAFDAVRGPMEAADIEMWLQTPEEAVGATAMLANARDNFLSVYNM